jgi:hypothetical protein
MANIASKVRHGRVSSIAHRVPAPLPGRAGVRGVFGAGAQAGRVPLPVVRAPKGLGAFDQGVHLGVRRLRPPNLGDRRHDDARIEAAAHRLVLGGVSDGHPFQRHRRPATAGAAGVGIVQVGLAAVRQAAPGDGRPRPLAARRSGGGRRDGNPLASQG